jgi:hypothetical protein
MPFIKKKNKSISYNSQRDLCWVPKIIPRPLYTQGDTQDSAQKFCGRYGTDGT